MLFGGLALLALTTNASPGFKVVANATVPTRSLSRTALAQVFMKKSVRWPDGSAVTPVDLPVGSATREAFSRDVHGKGGSAVDAYWQKQIFTGRELPPLTKASDAEVLAYVRTKAGAIGYVSSDAETGGLRLIEVE